MRNSIDLTQEQAGNLLHVSTRHYRRWEVRKTDNAPSVLGTVSRLRLEC